VILSFVGGCCGLNLNLEGLAKISCFWDRVAMLLRSNQTSGLCNVIGSVLQAFPSQLSHLLPLPRQTDSRHRNRRFDACFDVIPCVRDQTQSFFCALRDSRNRFIFPVSVICVEVALHYRLPRNQSRTVPGILDFIY
jgi:hypothetical protein